MICLKINENCFLIFCTKLLQSLQMETFYSKNTIVLETSVENETIFKAKGIPFTFKKMLLTDANETNMRNLHSLFSVFAADKVFFDKLL